MTKLMEEGLHLAQCQQSGFLGGWLCEIHHHTDMGTHILTFLIDILALVLCHPSPTLLAFARMEVCIEHSQIAAIFIKNLVGFHVRMIDGDSLIFLEGDAVKAVSQTEDAVNHLVQLEVRTQHLGIEVVFLQLQLMGIERGIPWFQIVWGLC